MRIKAKITKTSTFLSILCLFAGIWAGVILLLAIDTVGAEAIAPYSAKYDEAYQTLQSELLPPGTQKIQSVKISKKNGEIQSAELTYKLDGKKRTLMVPRSHFAAASDFAKYDFASTNSWLFVLLVITSLAAASEVATTIAIRTPATYTQEVDIEIDDVKTSKQ